MVWSNYLYWYAALWHHNEGLFPLEAIGCFLPGQSSVTLVHCVQDNRFCKYYCRWDTSYTSIGPYRISDYIQLWNHVDINRHGSTSNSACHITLKGNRASCTLYSDNSTVVLWSDWSESYNVHLMCYNLR